MISHSIITGASGRERQTDEECIEYLISEDPEITSNARITSKVARKCLESLNPSLQDYGSAICYNIATRDIRVKSISLFKSIYLRTLKDFNSYNNHDSENKNNVK